MDTYNYDRSAPDKITQTQLDMAESIMKKFNYY